MATDKKSTGLNGERLAEDFLIRKGYALKARNYRFRHAEIDLIVQKDNFLVFVEVKTRRSSSFGEPEAFVTGKKADKVMEAAEDYVYQNDWNGPIRFDIVAITLGNQPRILHFEDAFH